MIKAAIAIFCASIAAIALFYGHFVIALICLALAFAMLLAASARTSRRRRDGSNSNSSDNAIWFASSAHSSGYNDRVDCDNSRGSDNAGDCGSDAGDGGGGGSGD